MPPLIIESTTVEEDAVKAFKKEWDSHFFIIRTVEEYFMLLPFMKTLRLMTGKSSVQMVMPKSLQKAIRKEVQARAYQTRKARTFSHIFKKAA